MRSRSIPAWTLFAFGLLSVADFALTRYLLSQGYGAYEANPLANWMLKQHGWAGLAAFKTAAVMVVGTVALAIHMYRPRAGRRVLAFGCAVLAAVVLYSGGLVYSQNLRRHADPDEARVADHATRLDAEISQGVTYHNVLTQISAELAAGQLTLAEATDRLAATDKGSDFAWRATLRNIYLGLDDRGSLAASVVQFTLGDATGPTAETARMARRLLGELYVLCGTHSPAAFGTIPQLARILEVSASPANG